jgi:hypothetical protein
MHTTTTRASHNAPAYRAQGVAELPVTDADGRGVWQSAGVTAGNRGLPGLRAGWPVR